MLAGENAHRGRIGLSRSAMSDRVALVKLRSLSIGPLREKYASVLLRCGQTAVDAPAFSSACLCVRACVCTCALALTFASARMRVCARLHRVCPSIINTQSYGRLNAGSPPGSRPIIICGIVRVGPISQTAVDRDLSIAVDKIISPSHHLRWPLLSVRRLFARFRRGSFATLTSFPARGCAESVAIVAVYLTG